MGLLRRRLHLILALTLVFPAAAAASDRAVDASIRQLRRVVVPRRDGSHLLLLTSLRQLRDPTLRSFYYQLSQYGSPLVRIHAILGLAEIDESGQIDPWLISQLDSPEARYAAISHALMQDLIDTEHIEKLLEWDDLESKARGLLLAEQVARGGPPDREALAHLAEHPTLHIAGLASCVLAQLGDSAPFSAYRARVEALPRPESVRHLRVILGAVAEYKLDAVIDWVVDIVGSPDTDPEIVAEGIATVLVLDPPRGVSLWTRALGSSPGYGKCVRYALLLLKAGSTVPASAYDRLPKGDELIDAMAQAGEAISSGQDAAGDLIALLDMGHLKTARWAMSAVKELPEEQAARIYLHLLDGVDGDRRGRDERAELAMTATARLFEIDPETVTQRLAQVPDDSLTQQAMLLGLLESRSPAAGEAARGVKRIGFSQADSVALILIAKHAQPPSADELAQLGIVASGGGRVSEGLRAQAAWLYLKHTSKIEQALAETFADASSG
ncbi:MAG: hypothetical protein ACYS15_08485 [Planctomycetota bacterium]|jgi:hypothetical protein